MKELTVNQLVILLDVYRGTFTSARHFNTYERDLVLLISYSLVKYDPEVTTFVCTMTGDNLVLELKKCTNNYLIFN